MRWLLWRELVVITRIRPLWIAMSVQALTLTALLLVWSDGVPVLAGAFLTQFNTFHFVILLLLLPWVAARATIGDGRDVCMVATLSAYPPRAVVIARSLALTCVLVAVAVSALPFSVLALRISNADALDLARSSWRLLPLVVFIATLTTTLTIAGLSRLPVWLLVSVLTLSLGTILPEGAYLLALLAMTVMVTVVGAYHADQHLRWPPTVRPIVT